MMSLQRVILKKILTTNVVKVLSCSFTSPPSKPADIKKPEAQYQDPKKPDDYSVYQSGETFYAYDKYSFYSIENEMEKSRLSRVSNQGESHAWANIKAGQDLPK